MKRLRLRHVDYVRLGAVTGVVLLLALALMAEARSSRIQSWWFSRLAREMRYPVHPGPNDHIRFPKDGPYDLRLGYARLPAFIDALKARGFAISSQAEPSPELERFMARGGYAIYREKRRAGLSLLDRSGVPLYAARFPQRAYRDFESIPPLLVRTLQFIEDRDLLKPSHPRRNPAVDWSRLPLAVVGQVLGIFQPHWKQGGASTLATQIEKFRHSPAGRTSGAGEKWRQMLSASVRAYLDGPDTTAARRRILATYLDSTPLSSQFNYGEVIGLGNGLWAWYGTDFDQANRLLTANVQDSELLARKARVYRQALSLLLAEQRPSYFLLESPAALEDRTVHYLHLLTQAGVIDPALGKAALAARVVPHPRAPPQETPSFVGRKAVDALRIELLQMLHLPGLNTLDRLDLTAKSTLDRSAEDHVSSELQRLASPDYLKAQHLIGDHLLGAKGAGQVVYSVVLYERVGGRNVLRVRADSIDEPFDINSGAKLQLGSTAKLRTLVTYLNVVAELHERLSPLSVKELRIWAGQVRDPISLWAVDYLIQARSRDLKPMLEAAMQRHYSASPGEVFFTGSGEHVFHNFEKSENYESPTVEDALARSINLAFVRLLRDLTRYYTAQSGVDVDQLLHGGDEAAREAYLQRFSDQEGRQYLNRFYDDYHGRSPDEALEQLAGRATAAPQHLSVIFRSVRPQACVAELKQFLTAHLPRGAPDDKAIAALYDKYSVDRYSLDDRAFLADVHPLELWLVAYLQAHPAARRAEVLQASTGERQEAYRWLFRTRNTRAQNARIRILLEQDAFNRILEDWRRQGYPFGSLVPSLATAIGSSGDRPDALATLMGIILNDGLRLQTTDLTRLRFAEDTPFETGLRLQVEPPQRVLAPEVAAVVRQALQRTVAVGTAVRLRGVYQDEQGVPLPVGGKTGTGDNRYDSYAPGHRLIASRPVNRTATFVFYLGDRFFGTVTAYVPGAASADFQFTSALAVEVLRLLEPDFRRLLFPKGASGSALAELPGEHRLEVEDRGIRGPRADAPAAASPRPPNSSAAPRVARMEERAVTGAAPDPAQQ